MRKDELEAFLLRTFDEAILEEDRCIKITFRISKTEKAKLENICQGVKISHYIRAVLFDNVQPQTRSIIPRINRAAYVELSQINKNLVQLKNNLITLRLNNIEGIEVAERGSGLGNYQAQITELSKIINQVRKVVIALDLQETDKED